MVPLSHKRLLPEIHLVQTNRLHLTNTALQKQIIALQTSEAIEDYVASFTSNVLQLGRGI